MNSKNYVLITLASTIIFGLLYRYYNHQQKKQNVIKSKKDNNLIYIDDNQKKENFSKQEEEEQEQEDEEEVISEYSNDSIDSDYYPNWNNLLNELIKSGCKVYDSHICNVDKENYQAVIDLRNHNNRFWIKKEL